MKPDEAVRLCEFNAWANSRVLDAVATLTPEQFLKDLRSSMPSVRDTLAHIYAAEKIWLERLKKRPTEPFAKADQFPAFDGLKAKLVELDVQFVEYSRGLREPHLQEEIAYQTLSYGPSKDPCWQMIQHVVNHSTYHRGQVITMLRQLGAKGVSTDLIKYYREQKAASA